jgi:N-acetylglutamate synthase-like GNAT family acetyltransferase
VNLIVRRATENDVAVLAQLIDGFAKGHPAEGHPRSMDAMRDAFFGNAAVARVLLAEQAGLEKGGRAIGFGAWRKTYDVFWSMYGGEGLGLYVTPEHRGSGAAVCLIAAMCAEIRDAGGHFLQTNYAPELASLYERVAVGSAQRACHVSALAFEKLAAAAGKPAREIIRILPDKSLNHTPVA